MTILSALVQRWPWAATQLSALRAAAATDPVADHSHALREARADHVQLTRDMHHRVKNNLQIVASIISLQARETDSAEARRVLAAVEAQIQTLTLVQRWTLDEGDGRHVDLDGLIGELCAMLSASLMLTDMSRLQVTCAIEPIALNPDQAMPVAFLITGLALRSAQSGAAAPSEAHVTVTQINAMITITLASPGLVGADLARATATKPAPRLVAAMVRQLQGTLAHDADGGICTVSFAASQP